MSDTQQNHRTPIGLRVVRRTHALSLGDAAERLSLLARLLDQRPGGLLTSGFEYPGRYTRWDVGFVDPPLCLTSRGRAFTLAAHNPRGRVLLVACHAALRACPEVAEVVLDGDQLTGRVPAPTGVFTEEQRARRPSVISVLRCLREAFACPDEPHLGFYGAFGYDLVFQLEELIMRRQRPAGQRDLCLMVPDRLVVVDHRCGAAHELSYEFAFEGMSTDAMPCPEGSPGGPPGDSPDPARPVACQAAEVADTTVRCDHEPGGYPRVVRRALAQFASGDLFEVTPSQEFASPVTRPPSQLFDALRRTNPAPYGFLLNLGDGEHLVGASPEMFVRVRGKRVETCPIAGTIARGANAIQDADQVLTLLRSDKDTAELTMCTDVDRNDKARVCEPGSVEVIGRRQIEMYARLIHTVDHVHGTLRSDCDALDALVAHAWAVTVTGAPKQAAMQFIEDHERSARGFYSGAVGAVGFDGSLNTGLTLRAMQIRDGIARVRAGATLLHASDPKAEDRECHLKASALMAVLARRSPDPVDGAAVPARSAARRRPPRRSVLLVDHRDSFVHTLADYLRQLGATVTTLRAAHALAEVDRLDPDLVLLSPGPGRPADFAMSSLFARLSAAGRPGFGVCLGLQGLVEYAGGVLGCLERPRHGDASPLLDVSGPLFEGLPRTGLRVGRYHSLFADLATLPSTLRVEARAADDGCVMAVQHRSLPLCGVQFHPESIMSAGDGAGLRLLGNVLTHVCRG